MTLPKTLVYLRADGNGKIGLGHVHRLLSLNEILKDNFECKFIIRSPMQGIREMIIKNCDGLLEIDNQKEGSGEISQFATGKEIVVLDGYNFGTEYQQRLKEKGSIVVSIDDLHQDHFVSDAVINPAGGLLGNAYSKASTTKLFLGPEFALLKKPFLEASKKKNKIANSNSLFICLGGADPDNHTQSILKRCLSFPIDSFNVVVGEGYIHRDKLEREIAGLGRDVRILMNLNPAMMAKTMKECAVAVCSASGVAYEYLSVGGELYIKQTANNQADIYGYLLGSKLAFSFDDFRVNENSVTVSLQKQREVFDGNSDKRILKIFNRLDLDFHSRIRKATTSDLNTLFDLANDPEIRAQSYSKSPILLDDHIKWLNRKLNDPDTILYIFEYKNEAIGQVRFDIKMEATISYSIDKRFRGRGWGQPILQKAIDAFINERHPMKIVGFVKKENLSSNMIFKNLEFAQLPTQEFPDSFKYELTLA